MADLFIDGGAEFSECRTYRYLLWRKWSWQLPLACVLLNPSTGDEHRNDPTNERCERRARACGGPARFSPWNLQPPPPRPPPHRSSTARRSMLLSARQ